MNESTANVPLIIDFDNTLVSEDTLTKSFLTLKLSKKVLILLLFLTHGKVYIKNYLWHNDLMNLNIQFNSYLLKLALRKKGFIVSGSLDIYIKRVLLSVIPNERIFGTKKVNLTGRNKMRFLVKKFGYKKFDYIGDSFSDIKIWKSSNQCYTVRRLWLYKFFVPNLKHINEIL